MKQFLIFAGVFLLLVSQKVFSQNYLDYYQTINRAEITSFDKDFQKADSLYQVAFNLVVKPFKEDYYLAALNAEKLHNNKKVYSYLKRGIANGLIFKRIKKLHYFRKSKFYKQLKENYRQVRKEYLKTLNIPLRNEIAKMIRKDQRTRIPILGSWKQSQKVDAYNYKRLLEIIKENNGQWLGFSIIGERTPKGKYNVSDNIALLLLHFTKEQIDTLKPYLLDAVFRGEMYPYHYARIIDYKNIKLLSTKEGDLKKTDYCFMYGTYTNCSICDCKKAEIERKKIGLEPLDEYYRKANSTYICIEK